MAFKIYSPSYKRAELACSHKILPVHYVVHESEKKAYLEITDRVVAIPDSLKGNIARVRNWIMDNGGNQLLMVDDDLKAIGRWEDATAHILDEDQAMEFIEHGFIMAKQFGSPMWGVNLISDKSAYREYTPFCMSSPVLGPFSAHAKNPCRYDERLFLKEDYDLYIQVMNRFRKVLRFNQYFYRCDHKKMAGGCSTYRTVNEERKQFEMLRKKWGSGIIRIDDAKRHVGTQKSGGYDLNPWVKVPIAGV